MGSEMCIRDRVQVKKVIDPMAGNDVDNHADLRSPKGLDTDLAELSHDGVDTYSWDNSQMMLDLANFLDPGEVARIVIRAENGAGNIRGYSAPIFVTIPVVAP